MDEVITLLARSYRDKDPSFCPGHKTTFDFLVRRKIFKNKTSALFMFNIVEGLFTQMLTGLLHCTGSSLQLENEKPAPYPPIPSSIPLPFLYVLNSGFLLAENTC